jgi:hypothetical protein
MNTLLRVLLAGVFAATMLVGCNKTDEAAEAAKGEMSQAVDPAASTASEAVTDAVPDVVVAPTPEAAAAKEEAVDAIQAAKDAAAADAAK